jgi:Trp operon repressor
MSDDEVKILHERLNVYYSLKSQQNDIAELKTTVNTGFAFLITNSNNIRHDTIDRLSKSSHFPQLASMFLMMLKEIQQKLQQEIDNI